MRPFAAAVSVALVCCLSGISSSAALDDTEPDWSDAAIAALRVGWTLKEDLLEARGQADLSQEFSATSRDYAANVLNAERDAARRLGYVDLAEGGVNLLNEAVKLGFGGDLSPMGSFISKAVDGVVGYGADGLREDIRANSMELVAQNLDNLVEAAGVRNRRQLFNLPAEEIAASLEQTTSDLSFLRGQSQEDGTRDLVIATTVDVLANTQREALERMGRQRVDIDQVRVEFNQHIGELHQFRTQTEQALQNHTGRLFTLEGQVGDLQGAMRNVQSQLQDNNSTLRALSNLAFNRMSPAERIRALDNGALDAAFRVPCPSDQGGPSRMCASPNMSAAKSALREQAEREQDIVETIGTINDAARDIAAVAQIANNLGLDIPLLDDAANYGVTAANAVSQVASGNYLGALASVSGLFSDAPNPDAERHGLLMAQFGIVNQKLDAILDNQRHIIAQLDTVQEMLRDQNEMLDRGFTRLEFYGRSNFEALTALLNERWSSCLSVQQAVESVWRSSDSFDHINQPPANNDAIIRWLASSTGQERLDARRAASDGGGRGANRLDLCLRTSRQKLPLVLGDRELSYFPVYRSRNAPDELGLTLSTSADSSDALEQVIQLAEVYYPAAWLNLFQACGSSCIDELATAFLNSTSPQASLRQDSFLQGYYSNESSETPEFGAFCQRFRGGRQEATINQSVAVACDHTRRGRFLISPTFGPALNRVRSGMEAELVVDIAIAATLAVMVSDLPMTQATLDADLTWEAYLQMLGTGGVVVDAAEFQHREEVLLQIDRLLTLTIGATAIYSGPDAVEGIESAFQSGDDERMSRALYLLESNPFLFANFVMTQLDSGRFPRGSQRDDAVSAHLYHLAAEQLRGVEEHPREISGEGRRLRTTVELPVLTSRMNRYFPLGRLNDAAITQDGTQRVRFFWAYAGRDDKVGDDSPSLCIEPEGFADRSVICQPLPWRDDYEARALVYPRVVYELISLRNMVRSYRAEMEVVSSIAHAAGRDETRPAVIDLMAAAGAQ